MATYATTLLFLFLTITAATATFCLQEIDLLQMAQTQVSNAMNNWFGNFHSLNLEDQTITSVALRDCAKLYEESESRLSHMISNHNNTSSGYAYYTKEDALTWVSAVMTNHRTCLDGLQQKGYRQAEVLGRNLTILLSQTLGLYAKSKGKSKGPPQVAVPKSDEDEGLLASWSASTYKAHFIVAQDGSGTHKTIREAVNALASKGSNRPSRAVIYVKAGVYNEKVEIGRKLHNVMFVGDGMDKTVVTGSRSVVEGSTTLSSATFDVSGDGFWARDMTFENTAGPQKHQAVALKVSSDLSAFYQCSFKAYQDTLYVHSNRHFYRDCRVHGTIDFIFGDAAAVLQNTDILVRKPMTGQSNFITAQGRDHPNKPTGISVQNCRVRADSDFSTLKDSYKTFLGRPWKEYSRTVFLKSDLDGLVNPRGWGEWSGNFAVSTLYYGEYMNIGSGASTKDRVNWPGFHVLRSAAEASPFTVTRFLQGDRWIPATGVPFWSGI